LLDEGLSLDMQAPDGATPGDVFYIMQPGILKANNDAPGEQAWFIMDTMVVGADGRMRTTSPPNLGLYTQRGEIGVFFIPSQVGTAAITSPGIVGQVFVLDDYARRLQSNQSLIARGQSAPLISMETALGTGGE